MQLCSGSESDDDIMLLIMIILLAIQGLDVFQAALNSSDLRPKIHAVIQAMGGAEALAEEVQYTPLIRIIFSYNYSIISLFFHLESNSCSSSP